jgi:hypothetical protein
LCKNYSLNVNFQAKKISFSFPSPPTGGREKGKEKLDFTARTLTLNKQYLHSSHQIYNEKYYCISIKVRNKLSTLFCVHNDLCKTSAWLVDSCGVGGNQPITS